MRSVRRWSLVLGGLLAVSTAACSGSSHPSGKPTVTIATRSGAPNFAADYVTQVNVLCAELMKQVVAINGGIPPTLESFRVEHPQMVALTDAFDARVDALPVQAGERSAAEAFDAFRQLADSVDARLAAAAATGDEQKFHAAYEDFLRSFDRSNVPEQLSAAGISCGAR